MKLADEIGDVRSRRPIENSWSSSQKIVKPRRVRHSSAPLAQQGWLFSPLRRNRNRRGGDSPTRGRLNETSRLLRSRTVRAISSFMVLHGRESDIRHSDDDARGLDDTDAARETNHRRLLVSYRHALSSPPLPTLANRDRRGEPRPLPGQLQVRAHLAHRDRPRPAVALGAGGLPHRARVVRDRGRGRECRGLRRAARVFVGGAPPARLVHLEQRHRHPNVCDASGRVRAAAASCAPEASAERRASTPARIKKTVESLGPSGVSTPGVPGGASSPAPRPCRLRPPPSATFAASHGNAVDPQALQFDGCERC